MDQSNVVTTACPVTFTFTATITYTGNAVGRFQYVWLRSDGAIDTNQTFVSFSGPGTQQVTTQWIRLGDPTGQDPRFKPFNGWEQLQLQAAPGVAVLSNRAMFSLTCNPPPPIP